MVTLLSSGCGCKTAVSSLSDFFQLADAGTVKGLASGCNKSSSFLPVVLDALSDVLPFGDCGSFIGCGSSWDFLSVANFSFLIGL